MKWQASLHLNFIDFEKASDSLNRVTRDDTSFIQRRHSHSLLDEGNLTAWFALTVVKQGCMLSPLLILISLDWVTKDTTSHQRTRIRQKLTSVLEDLDYADDLCLLSSSGPHISEKTTRLSYDT